MITKDMNILEAVQQYPVLADIFRKHGLGCVGGMIAAGETLGEGISAHGLDADAIIAEANELVAAQK